MPRTRSIIGELIKKHRTRIGLTQHELANKLNTDRQYISKLESGKINMTLDYLDNVLKELNCTIKELFN